MVRKRLLLTLISLMSLTLSISACGNGGHVDFNPDFLAKQAKPTAFNLVPASRALAIESGKTIATGYSAKLQLSDIKGTHLAAGNGYTAQVKYTVRNR